jgi:hypothetical protein
LLAVDDASDLICLKLRDGESSCFSIIMPTAQVGCLLEPAMDGIPGDALCPSDRRLVQALSAKSCDFIKGRATVLESMAMRADVGAKRLPASPTLESTPFPRLSTTLSIRTEFSETTGLRLG